MNKKRLLYFYVGNSTFVKKDIEIFSKKYEVLTFNFEVKLTSKWKIIFRFISQIFFLLRYGFYSKIQVCQFSGYHSFLPVLFSNIFRKKSLIISGGMDCVSFPSIGYGNFYKSILKKFTTWSFKLATHISPKHDTLWYCEYTYEKNDFPYQGIKQFIPDLKTPYTVIHNGYDSSLLKKNDSDKKNIFLTVAGGLEYPFQAALKGVDLILEVAASFPDYTFIIVGAVSEKQFNVKSENIILLTKVPHEKLIDLYSEAKFYFQLSMAEGFPNALCEAMLCECIPIGSDVFSIPEIIGDTGYVLKKRNSELLIELLKKAKESDSDLQGKKARHRIIDNYSLSMREQKLLQLLENL